MLRYLRTKLPRRHRVLKHWSVRPFRHLLKHPRHWHIHRIGVARAMFIGVTCAWSPIPGSQMVFAALWAGFAHANIPTSVASTWLTNPFTAIPMYFAAWWVGDATLTFALPSWESTPFSLRGLWSKDSILIPLTLGCVICGLLSGYVAYLVTNQLWRRHILAKRAKQIKQRAVA